MLPVPRLLLAIPLLSPACSSFPKNAVLLVQTTGGQEVGVSTPHGVVFAGRSATEGTARIIGFFGDGPAIETVEIVPVAANLFTAELEIRFPEVDLSFEPAREGERLRLAAYVEGSSWTGSARVLGAGGSARVEGGDLPDSAAAFRKEEGRWRLVGLVSRGEAGSVLLGPETLWRILFRPRPFERERGNPRRPDLR